MLTDPNFRKEITAQIEADVLQRNAQAKLNRAAGYPEVHKEAEKWFSSLDTEERGTYTKLFGKDPYNCHKRYTKASFKAYYKAEGSRKKL